MYFSQELFFQLYEHLSYELVLWRSQLNGVQFWSIYSKYSIWSMKSNISTNTPIFCGCSLYQERKFVTENFFFFFLVGSARDLVKYHFLIGR